IALTPNYLPATDVTVTPVWPQATFTPASVSWTAASTALTQVVTVTENDLIDDSAWTPYSISSTINYAITGTDAGTYAGISNDVAPNFGFRTLSMTGNGGLTLDRQITASASISQVPTAGTLT